MEKVCEKFRFQGARCRVQVEELATKSRKAGVQVSELRVRAPL